ncbi:LpqB family beta-propeller domain-containing protein [Actinomadura sp. ATCC 31491]|uniref:LpqB family beta-propeller domain-containing protein n=1 Tax=Actinomadura luzonensis TaxID=2805427 RepID=A0ABT0G994_9ACTN|nr:LpqB family beta-propeller domain-containing protein [Actinomadura luzonensis]MCK2221170.1 LpqB family beta-propeller domain-containing protein [Actinomadura luzonensis]
MTRTSRIRAAAAAAAAVVLAGSGCSVIPVSGPYMVNDSGSGDPLSKPFQRMIATRPQPGWSAPDVIKGLQAAMAAYADDPTVLPQYLTPEALKSWSPAGAVTVLDDTWNWNFDLGEQDGTEAVQKVSVKAPQIARIEEDDTYVPQAGDWTRTIELVKVEGAGYRVRSLPPGLVLTKSDVDRAYRPTKLYYLGGGGQHRLVVDSVRLRLKPAKTYAQVILERLLKAPSAALQGAVGTGFPAGTRIESVRSGEDERVVVNLSGPIDTLDLSGEDALMAQIRYSLNNNDVAKGRVIEVQVDGEQYSVSQPNFDQGWLDNGANADYYVTKGAVHYMTNEGPGGAIAGPAGQPREGYSNFALSKQGDLVAAQTSTGISVTPATQEGQWQEVIQGAPQDLTAPSWHRDGSLWTFDRKNGVVLRYDPATGRPAQRVAAPGLKGWDVTRLRIARDGVRVVLTTGENLVHVGALTQAGGLKLSNVRVLTARDTGGVIEDLAWRDDEHVLVLVKRQAGQILNEIDIGDGDVTEIPLKNRLTRVAALNEHVLAQAESDKGQSQILELSQDQSWTTKIESDAETPLFPLG